MIALGQTEWTAIGFLVVMVVVLTVLIVSELRKGKQTKQRYLDGPGSPNAPVSADPWRRLCCALSGMYSRVESRGGKNVPEATYVGYSVQRAPHQVIKDLNGNWGVKNAPQAWATISQGIAVVTEQTAHIVHDRQESPVAVRQRLSAAGVSAAAADDYVGTITAATGDADVPGDLPGLAFDIGRTANLVRWSAYVGYIDVEQAHHASDALGLAALTVFDGWNQYGEAYKAGLSGFGRGGNKRTFDGAVDWLLTNPDSPWRNISWPR